MNSSSKNALDIIKENYTEFSKYTMQFRTYPCVYDGCKIAQRRVLYAMFDKVPASKKIKASSALGLTMLLHPHGEAIDTLLNLGGPHRTSFPLLDVSGNWGDNYGNPASASRYLECKLNDVARKLYFSYIDEAPFDNFEVEKEPLYLPTLFPLAFLQGCFSVGQGTPNPLIPDLQFNDLKKFIINYIKTGDKTVSSKNKVRLVDYDQIAEKDRDKSIQTLLNTGKGAIRYEPTIILKDNTITVTNLYVLAQFSNLMNYLKDDIKADKIDVRDESTTERIWIIEKVKNKVFDMEACAKMIKQKFTYKENYAMYFHDEEGRVKPYSLGEIISICYEKYKEALISKTNKDINKLVEQKMILECLALMSEHTDIVTNNQISDKTKVKRIKEIINDKYDEYFIEKSLAKPIHMLKNDKKQISKIEQEIADKQKDLYNIDDLIIRDLEKLFC